MIRLRVDRLSEKVSRISLLSLSRCNGPSWLTFFSDGKMDVI